MQDILKKQSYEDREILAETMQDFGFTIAAVAVRATLAGDSDAEDLRRIAAKFVNAGDNIRNTNIH